MWFDRNGAMEVVECDKSTIIKRSSVPTRDSRILGPVFSHSSNILGREKAIVVNLEVIKAIVTAEEVLLLDPLRPEVLPLIDQLKQQFPHMNYPEASADVQSPLDPEAAEGLQSALLNSRSWRIALELVCSVVDSSVATLKTDAWPVLDELTKNVSTGNLEQCYQLTIMSCGGRKHKSLFGPIIQNQQAETILEDLEMLLEAYFMQLEGMRNKILTVREYIDDTENYVNIQLDNQRNQLTLTITSFAIAAETLLASLFGMNIPCPLYNIHDIFWYFVWSITALCFVLFMVVLGYARSKKLLGS